MAARRLRYTWFEDLCKEHGYTVIAIAHHADDSIETFFINLFRGTGLKGLTGISMVNGKVIRPLLFASRREILDYAHTHHIEFREDSSNRSTKYMRNKIRLGLVPMMKEISPRFPLTMSQNVQRLTNAQLFINRAIELIRGDIEEQRDGLIIIHTERIDSGLPMQFVVYELLNSYGFKGDVTDELCHAFKQGNASGKRFYAKENVAYIDRESIVVAPISNNDDCADEIYYKEHKIYAGNSVLVFDYLDIDNVDTLNVAENTALLDADKLQFPLAIRRWRDGDTFIPFGMEGHKKVSDYLIDEKVSVADKHRQFVILNQGEIVWLVGRRIDNRYRITSKTENVLRITKDII
jgi:tRNA(Ile)-lysidine synthase